MRNRQLGVTALGWLILMTPFAIVLYAGMRLAPLYLNYMKVAKALDEAANELKTGGINETTLENAINRHFEIDMVEYPTIKDIKITRDNGAFILEAAYDDEAPLLNNISMRVVFDKKVRVGGGAGAGD
jgi:hypothetical protein